MDTSSYIFLAIYWVGIIIWSLKNKEKAKKEIIIGRRSSNIANYGFYDICIVVVSIVKFTWQVSKLVKVFT